MHRPAGVFPPGGGPLPDNRKKHTSRSRTMNIHWRAGRTKLPVLAALTVAAVGAVALSERPSLLHAAPLGIDSIAAAPRVAPSADPAIAKLSDRSGAFVSTGPKINPSRLYIT